MSWFSRCSWYGGAVNSGNCWHCTNVSFGDEFVHNPNSILNDETPDFSYPPSQPQTSSFDQFHCFRCGDPLEDGVCCQQCTCKWCGYNLKEGGILFALRFKRNSSIDAPNPNSFNDPSNIFTHPPQPRYESYSCELCGNDAHYGYDCPPRIPLVYEHEPGYNNYYPQNSPSFPQQYLNCEKCGGPHEDYQCQPWHQNYPEINPCYDSNSYDFEQPTQYSIDHQPQSIQEDLNQQRMNDVLKAVQSLVENDSECDLPFCDNSVTFSNPLFDANDDFTSSDDESLPEEDVPNEDFKIYSNPLFDFDDEYISSDVNPLFKDVLEDIESEDSYVSKLDEPDLLVTPLSKLNEDECFDPGGDFVLEEIEACLISDSIQPGINDDDFDLEGDILLLEKLLDDDSSSPLPPKELNFEELKEIKYDVSMDFEDDYYDSKGDIIYLESLLIKDTIHNFPPKVFLDHGPRSLKDEHDNDNLKSMVKVFDPRIHEKIISLTNVRFTFEDRHYLSLTYVI
ncbi:hypothetical protein Tco_1481935 [Tanacetum coccineum]